jgi:hypothetical protein
MLSILPMVFAALLAGPGADRAHANAPIVARPFVPVSADALLTATDRRVRALHPTLVKLVAEGVRKSATFHALMQAVARTDVIVYVEGARDMPPTLAGRMLIMPSSGTQRFMRVQVRLDARPNEIIATIAHELRHVLEVAEDDTVRDADGLLTLYKRIGHAVAGSRRYDTSAAQETGRTVRLELQG